MTALARRARRGNVNPMPINVVTARKAGLIGLVLALAVGAWASERPVPTYELDRPGTVVVLRHALAPGVGDPEGFDLNDCVTQRNLSDAGRAQARTIGARLRQHGARTAKVYTSAWCRCRETATLLGFGEPEVLPALNSFFADASLREPTMRALRAFLQNLPVDGGLVILVTHQVNITELTRSYPASGDGVILRLNGTEKPRIDGFLREPREP